jgi:ketosteroid isomerase-like protein
MKSECKQHHSNEASRYNHLNEINMAKKIFPTPADCEFAFYDAFERADIKLMMSVWSDDPNTVCIHPQGARLAGLAAIRDSFTELFSHGPTAQIKVSEHRKQQGQTLAIHSVYEIFSMRSMSGGSTSASDTPGSDPNQTQTVLATNVYALTPNGWRMVLHHATVAPQGTVAEEQGVSRILH